MLTTAVRRLAFSQNFCQDSALCPMDSYQRPPIHPSLSDKVFTVSEFLDFLNALLQPCRTVVQGEIGKEVKGSPHLYFDLLDKDGSALKCALFRNALNRVGISLKPGMEIRVVGYPNVWKPRGSLSFIIEKVELVGEGDLKKQFEELRKRLAAAGYFAPERKQPLPRFCREIGLVTSKQAEGALEDFKKHLGRFGFHTFLYDTRVEGAFAAESIVRGIEYMNRYMPRLDVLVLARGGGAWETFQPFNTEEVVRAIAASKIPVVSAIGHEKDETLADFAADVRASTPTHAAKLLTDSWREAFLALPEFEKNLAGLARQLFLRSFQKLDFIRKTFDAIIESALSRRMQAIEQCAKDFSRASAKWLEWAEWLLQTQEEKLLLASPEFKLKQGYSITVDGEGSVVRDATCLRIDQTVQTRFHKGMAESQVKKINEVSLQ